ncbi:hypothetical protein QR98_0056710 [Sarcoptes scabiei]|uniref:Uncharacterized protein n=1 Tax=Sarcoptes scabiei TaxID=52283 RepID=A0A132A9B0_SARSC|nr:hypothetical protein QR98_0056710 [Sarcoptes scabiei]
MSSHDFFFAISTSPDEPRILKRVFAKVQLAKGVSYNSLMLLVEVDQVQKILNYSCLAKFLTVNGDSYNQRLMDHHVIAF